MGGQYRYSRNSKVIGGVAVAGFLATSLFSQVGGVTAFCCLLLETGWVAFEVLRSAVLLVVWQAASAYLFQDSGLLHHFVQIGTNLWPLLCMAIGQP